MIGDRRTGDQKACPNGDKVSEWESPEGLGDAGDEPEQEGEGDDEGAEDTVGKEESDEAEEHGSEGHVGSREWGKRKKRVKIVTSTY